MIGERSSKLVIQQPNSVWKILVLFVWRSGWFFAHSCCRIETCERRTWEEFCVPIAEVLFCSLLLVWLDNTGVTRTRWVIAGWIGGTHRWPHVTKRDASRRPLCDWTGGDWEDNLTHAINSHLPQPAPAPLPQRKSGVNAKFVVSSADVSIVAKLEVTISDSKEPVPKKPRPHTEECGEGISGGRGKRHRWEAVARVQKGARRQKPKSSHGSDAQAGAASCSTPTSSRAQWWWQRHTNAGL